MTKKKKKEEHSSNQGYVCPWEEEKHHEKLKSAKIVSWISHLATQDVWELPTQWLLPTSTDSYED